MTVHVEPSSVEPSVVLEKFIAVVTSYTTGWGPGGSGLFGQTFLQIIYKLKMLVTDGLMDQGLNLLETLFTTKNIFMVRCKLYETSSNWRTLFDKRGLSAFICFQSPVCGF